MGNGKRAFTVVNDGEETRVVLTAPQLQDRAEAIITAKWIPAIGDRVRWIDTLVQMTEEERKAARAEAITNGIPLLETGNIGTITNLMGAVTWPPPAQPNSEQGTDTRHGPAGTCITEEISGDRWIAGVTWDGLTWGARRRPFNSIAFPGEIEPEATR